MCEVSGWSLPSLSRVTKEGITSGGRNNLVPPSTPLLQIVSKYCFGTFQKEGNKLLHTIEWNVCL
jgi:hypothetical protein